MTLRIPLIVGGVAACAVIAWATQPDVMVMHHHRKAAIPVLANDGGPLQVTSVVVVMPPAAGVATALPDGRVLYEHTTGTPAADVFTYRVTDLNDVTSAPETVTVTFSADARLPATTLTVPLRAPVTKYEVVDAFPGLSFAAPVSMESPPGSTNQLFVAERRGTIQIVTNVGGAQPGKVPFLDISSRVTNDASELGMKGIAFHPGYATNGIFFVAYCRTGDTVCLSRFLRSESDPLAADPESETILFNQPNDGRIHNINDPGFGPDGYLYLGMGDEGFSGDAQTNTQTLVKDIWSAILRIDPDKRPGNLEPNPHPAIPTNASGAHFSIPADNPFVGATQFNGEAVNPAEVRTEFYAVGFRNPWQFSFDALTGELWLGDVGHQSWESVSVMPPGGNGGWAFFEGTHPGPRSPPPGFTFTQPVWAYPHDPPGPYAGSAVIGGLVVRGSRYPELYGKFLCADVIFGHIWSVERAGPTAIVERIAGEGTIVQFGLDPSDGTVLMLDYDQGLVRRLVTNSLAAPYPQKLSETGVFADLADLAPNPGVVPYGVNLPFWSDHAIKQRWFALTNTTDTVGYAPEGPWSAPTGTVWIKHFDLEMDRGNPATRKRLETRLLVRTTNGSYGVSYGWNEAGTDATLVDEVGMTLQLVVTNGESLVQQSWLIPSRAECLACHSAAGGHALSFNTRQLNCAGTLADASGPFLSLLSDAGYLEPAPPDPSSLPRHVRPDETEYSLEARARSYLDVNCAYCHRGADSTVQGAWDGRAFLRLDQCGLVGALPINQGGDTNQLLLAPGSLAHSLVFNRMAVSNGYTRMPPLGSTVRDAAGIQLIADWLTQQLPGWQSYDAWRLARFASTNSPEGAPGADPDGDLRSNEEEFLTYTDPTNADTMVVGWLEPSTNGLDVAYDLFNRAVVVEVSTNLDDWSAWRVAGNDGLPRATGVVARLAAPEGTNRRSFFRFRVEGR